MRLNYWPYVTDEEVEVKKLKNLPKFTEQVSVQAVAPNGICSSPLQGSLHAGVPQLVRALLELPLSSGPPILLVSTALHTHPVCERPTAAAGDVRKTLFSKHKYVL